MYMLMFLLFKKNVCSQHILLSIMTKERLYFFLFFLQRETERAENKSQMYGLGDLPVFPEW